MVGLLIADLLLIIESYNPLLDASEEAVSNVIKNMGCDMLISELSEIAEETVKSYEVEINGETIPVLPIDNLTGHSVDQWNIHSGKYVPYIKNNSNLRIDGDEFFAEVFTILAMELPKWNYHQIISCRDKVIIIPRNLSLKELEQCLDLIKNFNTLVFCPDS